MMRVSGRAVALSIALLAGTPASGAGPALSQMDSLQLSDPFHTRGVPAISPDERQLYVPAYSQTLQSHVIEVYTRDASGIGSLVDTEPAPALGSLAISPDGRNAYAVSPIDDSIAIFARDAATGGLDALPGPIAVCGASTSGDDREAIALSPDGLDLYVACPTTSSVLQLRRDASDGSLDLASTTTGLPGPAGLAVSPDGAQLFVATPGDDTLHVFGRDLVAGTLSSANLDQVDGIGGVAGLAGVHSVAVPPDGRNVYVGGAGAVAVFSRDANGALAFLESRPRPYHQGLPSSYQVDVAVAATATTVWTFTYSRPLCENEICDPDETLTLFQRDATASGGADYTSGNFHVLAASDGFAYTSGDYRLTAWTLVSTDGTGLVTPLETEAEGVDGVSGLENPVDVLVTPDGRQVIVLNGQTPVLGVFARDPSDGRVAFVEAEREGLVSPAAFDVSPDGAHLYVADAGGGIAIFAIDGQSGTLTRVGTVTEAGTASQLAFAHDGTLFVGGSEGLAVFSRDPATGALTLLESDATVPPFYGLTRGGAAPASQVFALSDQATIGFDWNAAAGAIDVDGGFPQPGPAWSQAAGPDGRTAYVMSYLCGGDPCSATSQMDVWSLEGGLWKHVQSLESILGGVFAVGSPSPRSISRDGRFVYTIGGPGTVLTLARDRATGTLTWADNDEVPAARAVALSPDGSSLYVVTATGDLRVFAPEPDGILAAAGALAALALRRRRARVTFGPPPV